MTPNRLPNQHGRNQHRQKEWRPYQPGLNTGAPRLPVVLVTGLSGGGKLPELGVSEDLGFETTDNPPMGMLADMDGHIERGLAIGVDARIHGFDPTWVLEAVAMLRANLSLRPKLIYFFADEATLLRCYAENRSCHPFAAHDRVAVGIVREKAFIGRPRDAADIVTDTRTCRLAPCASGSSSISAPTPRSSALL